MEHAVEHQNAEFVLGGVAELASLGAGAGRGDREVAEVTVRPGERKHVGRVILAAKLSIEAAQLGVAGDQAIEALAASDLTLQFAGEAPKRVCGRFGHRTAKRDSTAFWR
jgi:hypothetical protein